MRIMPVLLAVMAASGMAGCGGATSLSQASGGVPTTAVGASTHTHYFGPSPTTTTLVPALQTHHPTVTVTPSVHLADEQRVQVTVSGFGQGGKFWISECADAADANPAGCGDQLAAQPFGVTDDSGTGSFHFTVTTTAATKPYNSTALQPCTDQCVLVATVGIGGGYAYAPLIFASG